METNEKQVDLATDIAGECDVIGGILDYYGIVPNGTLTQMIITELMYEHDIPIDIAVGAANNVMTYKQMDRDLL